MCMEPVSMGLAVAGAAGNLVGGIMKGTSEAAAARSNGALLLEQADAREEKAAFDADTILKKAAFDIETSKRESGKKAGAARAVIGGSGFTQESFSEILADDAAEASLSVQAIRYTADLDALEARYQGSQEAKQLRHQASGQYSAATDALWGGVISGVSGAATSLGSVFTSKSATATTSGWDATVSYG